MQVATLSINCTLCSMCITYITVNVRGTTGLTGDAIGEVLNRTCDSLGT